MMSSIYVLEIPLLRLKSLITASLILLVGILGTAPGFTQDIGLYEAYDFEFEGQSYDNPYTAVRFWAKFTDLDADTLELEGYWAGDSTWTLRFAPTKVGDWSFITFSNDSLLDSLSGSFTCIPSQSRGFLTTSGYHFQYSDSTPVFRMGDTCWRMFRSKNAPFDSLFKPYVDARASQGFNYMMGVIHTVGDSSINEGGNLWLNQSLDEINPAYFDWVDKRIEYLHNNGITTGLMLVWANTFAEFSRTRFSRFRRYVVGRYAAYDVVWIISGEYSERSYPSEYDYHADIIKNGHPYDKGDPYDHPISIHPSGQHSNTQDYAVFSDWLSFAMQQFFGSGADLHQMIVDDRQYSIPVANDEFGYEGPLNPADPYYFYNNQSPDDLRKSAWSIVMSGGHITYGNMYTYTGKEFIINIDSVDTEGAGYMSDIKDYFTQQVPYFDMQTAQSIVETGDGYALAYADSLFLVYTPQPGALAIHLNDTGYYAVNWYDPKTKQTKAGGILDASLTCRLFSPLDDDALLQLTRFTGPMARIRVYLQGAWSADSLHTTLYDSNVVPLTAPYSADPRKVGGIPANSSDWLELELRSTAAGPAVYQKSVFLNSAGYLTADNAQTSIVDFPNVPDGAYYIVLRHRNHFPVMSASAVTLTSGTVSSFDFTTSDSRYYYSDAAVEVETNVWAKRTTDLNMDGSIDAADYNLWYTDASNAASGYVLTDMNLDGLVNIEDYVLWYNSFRENVSMTAP